MQLKFLSQILVVGTVLFFACGCGGGGGNGVAANPFLGNYQGTFTSSNTGDSGTVTMAVDELGNVTGTLVDDAYNPPLTENMTGVIQSNGDISGDFDDSAGTSPYGGNLGFDTSGHLSGPINITTGGSVIQAEFNLADVTASGRKRRGTRVTPPMPKPPLGEKPILK